MIPKEVLEETEAAIARVDAAADKRWKERAKLELVRLATSMVTFSANDLTVAMDRTNEKTHEKRAIGPIMRWGAAENLIKKTGEFVPGIYGHCKPTPVWKSKIY